MLEVARKYDVDGLHFDYIRYPGRQPLLLRRLPRAVRGRQRPAGGAVAAGLLLRAAARGLPHLALPADHARWSQAVSPRGQEAQAADQDLGGRVRGLSGLPRVGGPGLGELGPSRATSTSSARWTTPPATSSSSNLVSNQLQLIERPDSDVSGHRRLAARASADRAVGQIHHARVARGGRLHRLQSRRRRRPDVAARRSRWRGCREGRAGDHK